MLRLKANVGIKWVYWKDRCPNFSSYICGCRSSEDQKKTLDETRRKLRTDLPTSQSQVITVVIYINCILDLLSKMSSSPHHISGPVQCLPHLHAGLCRGDGEQFQLTAPSNLRKFIQALLASEVWQAIRHLCGELLQALVQRGVPHPACGRTFLQGAPDQPTELNEY